jgi:hypothetical protein
MYPSMYNNVGRYIKHDMVDGWLTMRPKVWRGLDELHAGVFDGMSYEQIEEVIYHIFDIYIYINIWKTLGGP